MVPQVPLEVIPELSNWSRAQQDVVPEQNKTKQNAWQRENGGRMTGTQRQARSQFLRYTILVKLTKQD